MKKEAKENGKKKKNETEKLFFASKRILQGKKRAITIDVCYW